MSKYRTNQAGFIANVWREKDAEIELSDRAAKYLTPPYGNRVSPVEDEQPQEAEQPLEATADERPAKRRKTGDNA